MSKIKYQTFFKAITDTIEGICTHPEDLRMFEDTTANGVTILNAMPHQADYPKLVGAQGRIVNAVKHLFIRAGVNLGVKIAYNIEQSFVGRREDRVPFAYNPDFDVAKLETLVRAVVAAVFQSAEVRVTPNGEDVIVSILCDRNDDNHTTAAACNALFYPYGIAQGRMVNVKLAKA